MNVKTLILGVVMGGMIAAGTYFFVPTPTGAYANDHVTSRELQEAVDELKRHQCMAVWPSVMHDRLSWNEKQPSESRLGVSRSEWLKWCVGA